ncbi:MAG: T9SS type A sorting domain-containing protein [Reichenbachiella sp.]|uniref:T9SS type A sorting domain-containing protein n=1 Tax=Reichenbachiella sp. TaxID=2184521 RepID=UPI0029661496|nr:T9SS type A sorting domain-containing protein [Reichenbachiella sp.]MDW3211749.1 T9SS type A sorting domain-containing protein [Reichenbachiella sp.]
MKTHITTLFMLISSYCFSQTVHSVTVSVGQAAGCPVVASIEHSPYFQVFPNPTSATFTIQTDLERAHFRLIDMHGRTLRNDQLLGRKQEVDIEGLPKGMYILHLNNEKTSDMVKIRIK